MPTTMTTTRMGKKNMRKPWRTHPPSSRRFSLKRKRRPSGLRLRTADPRTRRPTGPSSVVVARLTVRWTKIATAQWTSQTGLIRRADLLTDHGSRGSLRECVAAASCIAHVIQETGMCAGLGRSEVRTTMW